MDHTEGPWEVTIYEPRTMVLKNGMPIAMTGLAVSTNESEANANLIAAAPDMEKALEKIIFEFEGYGSEGLDLAVAAIAKAKGE